VRLESKFDIRDKVVIDGDMTMVFSVVAIRWLREETPQYELGWMHEGRAEYAYFDEWRLSK
jgi:hypothetical protein